MTVNLNYEKWKNDHRKILEFLPGKNLMMFYSGGRDSSLVLHFLQRASEEFRFSFETHTGIYPHYLYPPEDRNVLDQYWRNRGVEIIWHEIGESDDRLATALAEGVSPCLICNTAKKKDLMEYIKKPPLDSNTLVLILSYSLWDLVSATIEHTLDFVYTDGNPSATISHKPTEERFYEIAQRFYPFLKLNEGISIFKPLIYYNDQDIVKVLSEEGIPILSNTCRYTQYRPKRFFAKYYEQMGMQFEFKKVFHFAQMALHLPDETFFTEMKEDHYLKKFI